MSSIKRAWSKGQSSLNAPIAPSRPLIERFTGTVGDSAPSFSRASMARLTLAKYGCNVISAASAARAGTKPRAGDHSPAVSRNLPLARPELGARTFRPNRRTHSLKSCIQSKAPAARPTGIHLSLPRKPSDGFRTYASWVPTRRPWPWSRLPVKPAQRDAEPVVDRLRWASSPQARGQALGSGHTFTQCKKL
jgi:hypothetical protein